MSRFRDFFSNIHDFNKYSLNLLSLVSSMIFCSFATYGCCHPCYLLLNVHWLLNYNGTITNIHLTKLFKIKLHILFYFSILRIVVLKWIGFRICRQNCRKNLLPNKNGQIHNTVRKQGQKHNNFLVKIPIDKVKRQQCHKMDMHGIRGYCEIFSHTKRKCFSPLVPLPWSWRNVLSDIWGQY